MIEVLYIEDNLADIELLRAVIGDQDNKISLKTTDEYSEIVDYISGKDTDVIVCDYNLRGFNGLDVLNLLKEKESTIPLIFLSSTVGEEKAVNLIKEGAIDFVLKNNLKKIPVAVERAFNESNLIKEKAEYQDRLHSQNILLDTLFNSLVDMVILKDHNDVITRANSAFCNYFDLVESNVIGRKGAEFMPTEEDEKADDYVMKNKLPYTYISDAFDQEGNRVVLSIAKSPLIIDGNLEGIVMVGRNITKSKIIEEQKNKIRHQFLQAENQTQTGSFEYDPENDILTGSPNLMRLLNLKSDHVSFKKFTSVIHPQDRFLFIENFEKATSENREFELEHRYCPANSREYRYCRTLFKSYPSEFNPVFYGTIQDTTDLRETSLALLNVQEEERERISKELHDNVGQKLSASSMFMDSVISKQDDPQLPKIKNLLDDSIKDIRSLSHVLTTSILESNTFTGAVEFLIDNSPNSDIIVLEKDFDDKDVSEFVGGQLYRILQEALNNIMKYSKATKVVIEIRATKNLLNMSISDNGKGFDIKSAKLGNGIRNMKERVRNFSGEFHIISEMTKGTQIVIKVPLHHE